MRNPGYRRRALILACLRDAFGIDAHTLSFLPIGADANTAVYRAEAADVSLFVKLRRGDYNAAATAVPQGAARCRRGARYRADPEPARRAHVAGRGWTARRVSVHRRP
ncbi:MAG: hypothetical protein HND48_21460 [Chloroflexi bacterium]|nr:hypothetical protein [Chloroflexota bacterium]